MLMFLSRLRILLIACAFLGAGVLALAVSILLISPERIDRRTWTRYYTLHFRDSETAEQLIPRIDESGRFQAIVSRFSSEISFNTFAGFVSVPIHRLDDRLDPLDPRFDLYMQGVGKLFSVTSAASWEAAYLRSDRNILSVYLDLRRLLGARDLRWRLIEFDPVGAVMQVLLSILYLTVLFRVASSGSIRAAVLLASVPWLPLVAVSDFPMLLAFFAVMPAWVHLFEHLYSHRYVRARPGISGLVGDFARPAAVLAMSAGLAVLLNVPGPFAALLMAMAGGAAAAVFLCCFFIVRDSLHSHEPFRALPILGRLRPSRTRMSPEITLHLLLALVVLFSYPLLRLGAAFSGPDPDTIRMHSIGYGRKTGLSWSSLAALAEYSVPGAIPNLADYLTHRAYQESLIFGRPYKFPTPGQRILISEYRVDPQRERIQKTFRVVKQFKESWLPSTLETAAPGSVARLLADQGFAGTPAMSYAAEPVMRYLLSVVIIILFLLHFLVPRHFNLTASALYATRNLTLRRH